MYVEYKHDSEADFTSVQVDVSSMMYTIEGTKGGEYDVRVVVVNNEGHRAMSEQKVTVLQTAATVQTKGNLLHLFALESMQQLNNG